MVDAMRSTNLGTETAPRAVSSAKTLPEIREKGLYPHRGQNGVTAVWAVRPGWIPRQCVIAIPAHFGGYTPADGKAAGSGLTQ